MATITQNYEPAVDLDRLSEHPRNPRRGNEAAIDASMAAHGFYGAVLAQVSTGHVIAGNHRLRVARTRGESTVPVLWLDVDDDQAERLLLVDNRTGDLAEYDDTALIDLLRDLEGDGGGLDGSGFEPDDLVRLINQLEGTGHPGPRPVDDDGTRAVVVLVPADRYSDFVAALDRRATTAATSTHMVVVDLVTAPCE